MEGFTTPSKIDLRFSDDNILFLICDCSLDKKYSFYSLSREDAKKFIARLRYLERMTWRQFAALDRKNGLTVEDKNSESFSMINEQNTSAQKIAEQYYFHFRVDPVTKFRVFGYQKGKYFCITHLDPLGKIHGH